MVCPLLDYGVLSDSAVGQSVADCAVDASLSVDNLALGCDYYNPVVWVSIVGNSLADDSIESSANLDALCYIF